MNKTPYEVAGFAFTDEQTMEKALKEVEGIRYIKNGTDASSPQVIFQVYCQIIEQQIFETPIGYAFLYEMQDYLRANPSINNEDIPAIPVVPGRVQHSKSKMQEEQPKEQPKAKTKVKVVQKNQTRNVDYKTRFWTTFSVSAILLLIVIGMFAVTATSDNINILNYENALIEKYEVWETKLNEKEERLRERENALLEMEAGNAVNTESIAQ